MDGATMGQMVEDMVKKLYDGKTIANIESTNLGFKNRHQSYHNRTQQALPREHDVVYQAGFLYNNLFVKTDFLVKNETGKYDLIEVKSKNSIREKTKAEPLLSDLCADISFQRYVLQKTLAEKFSGNCYITHVNKEYVKHGEIAPQGILIQECVNDELMTDDEIENILTIMQNDLVLSLENFNTKYPYDGGDYFSYFAEDAPKRSIRYIAGIDKKKKKLLYDAGKTMIADLTEEDILTILYNKDGKESRASKYIQLRKQGEETIDKQTIKDIFN